MLSAFSPALQALEQYPSQKANQQLLRQQRQEAKDLRQAIQRTPWWSKTLMVWFCLTMGDRSHTNGLVHGEHDEAA